MVWYLRALAVLLANHDPSAYVLLRPGSRDFVAATINDTESKLLFCYQGYIHFPVIRDCE